jgi:two-component sensor histidine kinase
MQLVCSLTAQLRGTVEMTRDGGTRFDIRFPAPQTQRVIGLIARRSNA